MIARAIACLTLLIIVLTTARANAERCGADAAAWVRRCAESSGMVMRLESCPASVAIVEVRSGDAQLRVEISTSPDAFAHAGRHGLSPIGSFPSWREEGEPLRRALDALVACARVEAPESLLPHDANPPAVSTSRPPHAPPPLLALAALMAAVVAIRRLRVSRAVLLYAAGAVIVTLSLRALLQPVGFFHQNGQGPEWIRYAMQYDAGAYGPGYPELYGFIATRVRRPDLAIFLVQQLLAATVPISAYALVRGLGCGRAAALSLAFALAIDPVLARTGRSESYYAAITALLFAACALLVATRVAPRGARTAGVIAAAVLVAQAARVHPIAWVACAMVPLTVLCKRPRDFIPATAAILVIAIPLVAPGMRQVFHSELGGSAPVALASAKRVLPAAAALLVAAALLARATRRLGMASLVLVLVGAAAVGSNVLRQNIDVVSAAYLHLFLPGAVAAVAILTPARVVAPAVVGLALLHAYRERPIVAPTTDNSELNWCMEWREGLPASSSVATLARVGRRTLTLPLFGRDLAHVTGLDDGAQFYYRSSLCASPEGEPLCAEFEGHHRLRLIGARRFPSRPSASWLPLPPGEIEVALFAVEGQR